MKYVTYNLIWNGGVGVQPYKTLLPYGVNFNGGVIVKDDVYFGYMMGTDEQCTNAISGSMSFNMKELSQKDALSFFSAAIPLNTEQTDPLTNTTLYAGAPVVSEDQTISVPWTTTKN